MLDLSAAFDTVDISILLETMRNDFGIGGVPLKWLDGYLRNRKQCVVLSGQKSKDFFSLKCGATNYSLRSQLKGIKTSVFLSIIILQLVSTQVTSRESNTRNQPRCQQ
jgi:hypothetical protein